MDPRRWEQVDRLVHDALERPPAEREAFVRQATGGDARMGDEVLSILAHADAAEHYLEPAAAPAAAPLVAGEQLGPYSITELIGEGGMGQVYRARDPRLGRDVAIKVLPPDVSGDPDRRARFEREARAVGALSHPNVVAIYDVGTARDVTFLVMELLEGETLRARLAHTRPVRTPGSGGAPPASAGTSSHGGMQSRGGLPLQKALDIATQVALGLAAAHARGIAHRDLKPENIFLTTDGRAKVLDFGLARTLPGNDHNAPTRTTPLDAEATKPGTVLGTVGYMAPEQVRGGSADHRADVFALGAILYEMLTGARAFAAGSAIETMSAVLGTDPLERRDIVAGLPPAVEGLVRHCLEKQPDERFQSARDLAFQLQALGSLPAGSGVAVPPPLRNRGAVQRFGNALAFVLLAGVAAWGWIGQPDRGTEGQPIFTPLTLDSPPRTRSPWTRGIGISRDGWRFAYYGPSGWYVLDFRTGKTEAIPQSVGLGLVFSPTGDAVAISRQSRVQEVDIISFSTGQSRRLADCCFGLSDWDVNGWLYHTDLKNNLIRTNMDGRTEILEPPRSPAHWATRSAHVTKSGRTLVFPRKPLKGYAHQDYEVVARDLGSARERRLVGGIEAYPTSSGHLLVVKADGELLAARFDEDSLEIGEPVSVLRDIEIKSIGGGHSPEASLVVSDNGTLVFVRRADIEPDTVILSDRSGTQRVLPGGWDGWIHSPSVTVSADGRWAMAVHRGLNLPNIWVRDVAEGPVRRLSFSDNLDYYPRFIPRSRDLAFVGSTAGKNWDLYRVPFDGTAQPSAVLDVDGDIGAPRFSADGRWVVFSELALGGSRTVKAFDLQAKGTPQALAGGVAPDISPDARWVVYQAADSTDQQQIFVKPFPGTTENLFQISTAGGTLPVWSSSGRELFYLNSQRQLVALPVTTGSTFSFGKPQVLFQLEAGIQWTREVLPGDQRFVLIRQKLEAPGQVIIIKNFLTLLEQKVGR